MRTRLSCWRSCVAICAHCASGWILIIHEEDWGFTAQQVVEKLLKAWIVLSDRRPPRVHELTDLASLADHPLEPRLAALQEFAMEARYEEGPFPLPAERSELLALLQTELERCEQDVAALG